MKLIRPFTVTDAALLSTNVPEADGLPYDPLITFAAGARAYANHVLYESVQNGNMGHALDDPAWWLSLGATNRWSMFDQINGSRTTNPNLVETAIQVTGRADGVAALSLSAEKVRIVASVPGDPRTNYLPYSEQFGASAIVSGSPVAVWTLTGATLVENADYSPYGDLAADTLVETTANSAHKIASGSINIGWNVQQCFSVYLKQAGASTAQLAIKASGGNFVSFDVDLAALTGVATNGGNGAGASGGVEAVADGFVRVWVDGMPDSTASTAGVTCEISVTRAGAVYTGDGGSGITMWGAQLEIGDAPTAYIETGSSPQASTDDVFFDEIYSLVSADGITNWYDYFFNEVVIGDDLVVTNVPPYADPKILVQVISKGSTAAIGSLVLGQLRDIGATELGPRLGIQDYSRKEADDFGNYTVVERAFSKRGNFTVIVPSTSVDALARLFSQYRATPVVWIGSDTYSSTFMFGFYRSFELEIAYPTEAICTLEIEGLT